MGDFTEVDLRDLAEEVKTVIFFSSERIVIEPGYSVVVRGSKIELARVFQNFFRNALEPQTS